LEKSRKTGAGGPGVIKDLEGWLEAYGVRDKDAENPEAPERLSAGERRRKLLARRPDAVIDLHGLRRDQARAALEEFFEKGRRRGFAKLSIIHGKGNHSQGGAVLKQMVREFIEQCPFAGESGQGAGGSGATWVLLKQDPASGDFSVPGK
jgi:DNA-nicking Smr family endonuclease